MAKILLIVAIVVSLATAGIGYVNKQSLTEAKDAAAASAAALQTAKSSLDTTTKELADATAAIATTTAEKQALEASLATAQAEVTKAAADLAAAQGEVATKTTEVATLTATVAERDKTIADLTANPTPAAEVATAADPAQLQELEALVASLETKNTEMRDQLGALEKEKSDRMQERMKEGLEGRVLAVNPAWNFVVLSIGDRNGVVNNAELLLKRGGQYLGKVRVTSVEPSTSIADIVANSLPSGVAVQPGDSVIFQSSEN